jgi:hypothetical protein
MIRAGRNGYSGALGTLTARDIWVSGIGAFDSVQGLGIFIAGGTQATIQRALIENTRWAGIRVDTATLALEDVLIRDVNANERARHPGSGLWASSATVTAERLGIEAAPFSGVSVDGGTATLDDLVVAGIPAGRDAARSGGHAVLATDVTLEIRRARLLDAYGAGIAVRGGSTLLEDVALDGVGTTSSERVAHGVFIGSGSNVTAERIQVKNIVGQGITVGGADARATLAHVHHTRDDATTRSDVAIAAGDGTLELKHVLLSGELAAGLQVQGPATLTATDLVIASEPAEGAAEIGVYAAVGAAVTGARWRVETPSRAAVVATGAQTTMTLTDATLSGAGSRDPRYPSGGIASVEGASVDLQRCWVSAFDAGALSASTSPLALAECVLTANAVATVGNGVSGTDLRLHDNDADTEDCHACEAATSAALDLETPPALVPQ